MSEKKSPTLIKIKNKTNQYFQLIDYGYLPSYGEILVSEVNEQMRSLEKKGLISIRPA
jgi:hypothetical protein